MINKKGQTLIEVIFVLAIIIIGFLAIMALIISNISGGEINRSKIVAYNLAREGVEAVRYIRDSNWLQSTYGLDVEWDDLLYNQLDENDHTAIAQLAWGVVSGGPNINTLWQLKFDPNSFSHPNAQVYIDRQFVGNSIVLYYQNMDGFKSSTSQFSSYYRLLTIDPICSDGIIFTIKEEGDGACEDNLPPLTKVGLRVISEVRWHERGRLQSVVIEDWLYDWY